MLSTDQIPQADRLERVLQLVGAQRGPSDPSTHDERDLAYYRQAARILGWLDEQHTLTPSGQALCEADASQQWPLAAQAFVASSVGAAWLKWSGVGRLDQLDEDSTEDFLVEHCEASASTARRRARTLKSWLRALRTFDVHQVDGDAALRKFLAGFLTDPALPTRMLNWAARHALRTIAELVARDPAAMQGEKNLGRKSISDTDALFRDHTGRSWEQLRAELPRLGLAPTPSPSTLEEARQPTAFSPARFEELSWDHLAAALPESARSLPLARLELPARAGGRTRVHRLRPNPPGRAACLRAGKRRACKRARYRGRVRTGWHS